MNVRNQYRSDCLGPFPFGPPTLFHISPINGAFKRDVVMGAGEGELFKRTIYGRDKSLSERSMHVTAQLSLGSTCACGRKNVILLRGYSIAIKSGVR